MNDLVSVILLFWPLLAMFTIIFVVIGFVLAIFVGGTLLFTGVVLYGLYSFLRDEGVFSWLYEKILMVRLQLTDHLRENIQKSFLIKGSMPLSLKTPVLYVCHPHGLYGFSWYIHFSACLSAWPLLPQKRPKLAVHSSLFRIPFVRELMYLNNCIQATESEILETLKGGDSVALVLGGIEELHKTSGDGIKLIIKKRNGFLRIAEKAGVPLVPLITVGENELFPFLKSPMLDEVQNTLYSWFHIALPVPTWTSFKEWIKIVDRPLRTPLTTYILEPVTHATKKNYIKRILDFAKSENVRIEIIG